MGEIKVENVIIGKQFEDSKNLQDFIKIANEKRLNVHVVGATEKLNIEKNLYLNIIWPNTKHIVLEKSLNNNALVCNLHYNDFSMLFTGDIERAAEEELVNIYKGTNILNSTVLKVAHHGSKSSSTEDFVKLVQPKVAIIGVGKNNLYGHPNEDVLERLDKYKVQTYRTDESGEISIIVNRNGIIKVKRFIEK